MWYTNAHAGKQFIHKIKINKLKRTQTGDYVQAERNYVFASEWEPSQKPNQNKMS